MGWASRHNLLARAVNRHLGGVSVLWGAVSGDAILEQNSEMVLGDQVISVEYALHNLPFSLFGGLGYGDAISVDGESYEVRYEPMRVGDGRFCIVALTKLAQAALAKLLLEGGDNLLLEDGGLILLEA